MAEEGNSLRDVMEDAIGEYLEKEYHEERSAVYEEACDLTDVAFKVMMVPEPLQDAPYTFCQDCAGRVPERSVTSIREVVNMECPKCGSTMVVIFSCIIKEDYIEGELQCPNCDVQYYGVLYPVSPTKSVGGDNESSDN